MTIEWTTAQLQELIAGTEGVTPGPWLSALWPGSGSSGPDVGILQGPVMIGRDKMTFHTHEDAKHIAACSPERIRSLCESLLAARAALEDIAGIFDANYGRQNEKLADIGSIAARALPPGQQK